MSMAAKTNVEHRFEKNDKLTRNKSSKNKKDYHQDLEVSFSSVKIQPDPVKREKNNASFKVNKCSKGKMQRDRRKMREKRRSTGVVYLGSEGKDSSSCEDDEVEDDIEHDEFIHHFEEETVKNTKQNETLENFEQKNHQSDSAHDKTSAGDSLRHSDKVRMLTKQLASAELKIATLEQELQNIKSENKKLSEENSVLLRAITKIK